MIIINISHEKEGDVMENEKRCVFQYINTCLSIGGVTMLCQFFATPVALKVKLTTEKVICLMQALCSTLSFSK